MEYVLKEYSNITEFNKSEYMELTNYHWEAEKPYRPRTLCKLGIVGEDLVAKLKTYEKNPRTIYNNINDPVYKDSCLEFFSKPIKDREEYINVECNSKGVYLSEIGIDKKIRYYVSEITSLEPIVKPFKGDDGKDFWGVEIHLTKEFLSDLFKIELSSIDFNTVEANFYKCGDDCEVPHYLAFSPVTTLPPGFHNPSCFALFEKECK